ncbi:MAG: hypothetical protein E7566_04180 [Ruminococcaceae bacterium]|nr:hypothetical protein [Oscillospiraceae bacterium]
MIKDFKRITIFAGHYGSGKTNIAVNYATLIKEQTGREVALADLDIVNPYYRAKDSTDILESKGIRMISSPFANSNVDLPALPAEAYAIIDDESVYAVCDVGGDDRGAYALGRYREGILKGDYEMLMVVNMYRPLTRTVEDVLEMKADIEAAAGIPFTGIVNNSNIGVLTTKEDVVSSFPFIEEIEKATNLPLRFTAVWDKIYCELSENYKNLIPLTLQERVWN